MPAVESKSAPAPGACSAGTSAGAPAAPATAGVGRARDRPEDAPAAQASDAARAAPGARASTAFARLPGERARPVRILVDVHERRSGIADGLESLGAIVRTARLTAGDYLLAGGTVVERKRVADLHSSVARGRFWPQVARLREAAKRAYLLIEGTDIDRGALHPASVRSICIAVIELGVPVLRSYQQMDSAIWIYRLALRAQARPRRGRGARPAPRPPHVRSPGAEAVLTAVPGISTASARSLLERFGSIAGLLAAGAEAWVDVPGIGPMRAHSLAQALRLPAAEAPDRATSEGTGGPGG